MNPGARIAPGRSVGICRVAGVAGARAEALNQLANVCGAFALGSTSWFTRQPMGVALKHDEPSTSKQFAPVPKLHGALPMLAVNGRPVWKVWTPETSHPPRMC